MLTNTNRQHKIFVLNMLYEILLDFKNTGNIRKECIDNIHNCFKYGKNDPNTVSYEIREILCIKDTEFDILYQLKFLIKDTDFLNSLKRELFDTRSDSYDNTYIVNSISSYIEGINGKVIDRSRIQTYFNRHPVLISYSKVAYRIRNLKSEVHTMKDTNISYNHRLHPTADIHKATKTVISSMVYKISMTDLTYYIPCYREYYDSIYELKLPKVS